MRFHAGVLLALAAAVLVLAFSSGYSAYVASTNHRNFCARTDLVLDTLHDIIVLAFTPQPGQKITALQVRQIEGFESAAFARIDQARC